ncbi:preprotein translocase subunit SecG [Danxiaibacter flavus]|uniref:Protein-export membrane protein SecG n=1 Tax=Danxiaibacter flavus TaxID=3049108 RepID=A0ABV3ZDN1_9BACT|nr:preprotein translocase subunit SecG [Chitinophagaceae bacterium DXS]
MTVLFFILILLAAGILGFLVLIQNPKGGGLAGNIAGFSNQFMGVKQTTDVLEKGTWLFSGIIALLCLFSILFFKGGATQQSPDIMQKINTNVPAQTAPATQQTAPATAPQTAPDSGKH